MQVTPFILCQMSLSPWLSLSVSVVLSVMLYMGLLWRNENMKLLMGMLRRHKYEKKQRVCPGNL